MLHVIEIGDDDIVLVVRNGQPQGTVHATDTSRTGGVVGRALTFRKTGSRSGFGNRSWGSFASGSGGYEVEVADIENPTASEVLAALQAEVKA